MHKKFQWEHDHQQEGSSSQASGANWQTVPHSSPARSPAVGAAAGTPGPKSTTRFDTSFGPVRRKGVPTNTLPPLEDFHKNKKNVRIVGQAQEIYEDEFLEFVPVEADKEERRKRFEKLAQRILAAADEVINHQHDRRNWWEDLSEGVKNAGAKLWTSAVEAGRRFSRGSASDE